MSDEYGAKFVFGIGHGSMGDDVHISNDPAKVKEGWVGFYEKWGHSNYSFNIYGTENLYIKPGAMWDGSHWVSGVWLEVGEFMNAPKTGEVLIQTLGMGSPYYASDGTSLYDRDDTLFKIVEGNKELEIPVADVMDSDVYLIPSATTRYPGEGWQPIGQLDMDE